MCSPRRSRPAGSRSTRGHLRPAPRGRTRRSPARSGHAGTTPTTPGSSTQVAPAIHGDCGGWTPIVTAGASMGAFHAANFALRRADLFPHAVGHVGQLRPGVVARLGRAWATRSTSTTRWPTCPTCTAITWQWLRRRVFIQLVVGSRACGRTPDRRAGQHSWALATRCWEKGIPARARRVGHDTPHDWPSWRRQARQPPDRCSLIDLRRTTMDNATRPTSSGCCSAPRTTGPRRSRPSCAPARPDPRRRAARRTTSTSSGSPSSRSTCATSRATTW